MFFFCMHWGGGAEDGLKDGKYAWLGEEEEEEEEEEEDDDDDSRFLLCANSHREAALIAFSHVNSESSTR